MSEYYLTNHCNYCGGGIEFPEHGIGTEISCPHCQKIITLKVEGESVEPLSKGRLLFLSKFRFATDPDSLGPASRWDGILDSSLSTVMHDLINTGLLEPVALGLVHCNIDF